MSSLTDAKLHAFGGRYALDSIIIAKKFFAAIPLSNSSYGNGGGLALFNNVQCVGSEDKIFHCPHAEIGASSCMMGETASVRCTGKSPNDGVHA